MGQLTNQFVSQSYQGLLNLQNANTGFTTNLQTITDGLGGSSPLQISKTQVNISGSFSINNVPITNGTSGTSGTSGVAGSSGTSGTSGVSGTSGTSGLGGSSGTSGTSGVSGSSGTSGQNGSSGTSGTSGGTGSSGTSGTSGQNGSSGTSGTSGVDGSSGTSGTSGVDGSSGTSGTSGSSGSSGTSGTAGTSGDSIFALTGSVWETSVQTKFNADSTFGTNVNMLQSVVMPTGSSIKLSPDPGGNSAAIRFLSGSNPASARWVNIQGVPGSPAGDVAISDFPTNNHFMFFDVSGHTLQFEAPVRSTGSAAIQILNGVINNTNYTPVTPGVGFINSGSLVNRGDVDVISNNTTVNIDNFITSSLLGQTNIFKGWSDNQAAGGAGAVQANYTGSLRITGSNNMVSMPQIRATGVGGGVDQQGYISGSDNIIATNNGGIYLNTGSLLFPKTQGNFVGFGSVMSMNFTTSSLAGGHPNISSNTLYGGSIILLSNSGSVQALATNLVNGGSITSTQNFLTNTRPSISSNIVGGAVGLLHISSSINYTGNYNNGDLNVANHLSSSNIANNSLTVSNNQILTSNTNPVSIYVSGSQNSNATRTISRNLLGGNLIQVSSSFVSSSNANLLSSVIFGNNLAVSASHTAGTFGGSAFFGRFNMTGSNLEDTQQVVFAVGTGTAANARRTGFLIDSGSNTRISGSLNVNGNTVITGSVTLSGSAGPELIVVGDSVLTGSLNVSGSVSIANAGDLTMYGHKMFNVGAFVSTETQSGSANVSQSINYNTTDYSQGVSVVSGSRLTVANAGVYNIQFSLQVDRISGSGTDTVNIWLKKNGTNVTNSAGAITIAGSAAQAKIISAWNYVVDAAANDYYELVWQTTDANIQLINATATGNIPDIPSVIVTVTQVR